MRPLHNLRLILVDSMLRRRWSLPRRRHRDSRYSPQVDGEVVGLLGIPVAEVIAEQKLFRQEGRLDMIRLVVRRAAIDRNNVKTIAVNYQVSARQCATVFCELGSLMSKKCHISRPRCMRAASDNIAKAAVDGNSWE